MSQILEWPEDLYGLEYLASFWGDVDTRYAPLFTKQPDLLVVHSASLANWVAEYLSNPVAETPKSNEIDIKDKNRATNGRRRVNGVWYRVAAAHICFYEGKTNKLRAGVVPPLQDNVFVQQASLKRTTPGAGGSVCQGRGGVNARAYHLELPAKPKDTNLIKISFRDIVSLLVDTIPSLKYWTTHKEIDPSHKRDPILSTGFTVRWMDGLGLQWAARI